MFRIVKLLPNGDVTSRGAWVAATKQEAVAMAKGFVVEAGDEFMVVEEKVKVVADVRTVVTDI